jgi:23S rRNA (adenine1618-N6)-methyltransferase
MIEESTKFRQRFFWFSTLISKESNLPKIFDALKKAKIVESKTINMAQGQKKSRIVAWTFLSRKQQEEWRKNRW